MKDKIKKEEINEDGKYWSLPISLRDEILLETIYINGKVDSYITATVEVCEAMMIKKVTETQPEFIARMIKSGWQKHFNKFDKL